ncbi:MAG: hypothetical protein AAF942_05500 [Pseudomonadota bacterium]
MAGRRVALATWQFVRLMVRLEESRRQSGARRSLYDAWREDWETLDAELEKLRRDDFGAFSELMIDKEVVFENVRPHHVETAAEMMTEVADQLARDQKKARGKKKDDLKFEETELRDLAGELGSRG